MYTVHVLYTKTVKTTYLWQLACDKLVCSDWCSWLGQYIDICNLKHEIWELDI